jgi:hypothetical protein
LLAAVPSIVDPPLGAPISRAPPPAIESVPLNLRHCVFLI